MDSLVSAIVGLVILASGVTQAQVKTKKVEGFGGVIAKKYKDSKEWWPKEKRPPKGAPNALILLLDDVGFAQLGQSFGGLIETPNIDRLAANGLRYNNFHTRLCVHRLAQPCWQRCKDESRRFGPVSISEQSPMPRIRTAVLR